MSKSSFDTRIQTGACVIFVVIGLKKTFIRVLLMQENNLRNEHRKSIVIQMKILSKENLKLIVFKLAFI